MRVSRQTWPLSEGVLHAPFLHPFLRRVPREKGDQEEGEEEAWEEEGRGGKRSGVSLGWARKALERAERKETGKGKKRKKQSKSPPEPGSARAAGEGGAPQGPERRAPGGRARARGIRGSARSFRGKRGPSARLGRPPPPGSSGIPFCGRESGKAPPAGAPSPAQHRRLGPQRRGRSPSGRGRRAQSWAAGRVTSARRILCCAPLRSGGSPGPAAPGPAASIRPQLPAQREIKPPPIPLHAFGETFPAAAGRWDFGEGARRRPPQPLSAPGRVPGSDVKASPPPPPRLPPPPPLPLRPPRR